MRNIYLAALVLVVLGSCSESEVTSNVPNEEGLEVFSSDFVVNIDEDLLATRSSYVWGGGNVIKFSWEDGDELRIYSDAEPGVEEAKCTYTLRTGEGNSAYFTGGGFNLKKNSIYYAFTPTIQDGVANGPVRTLNDKTNIEVSYEGQTQVGNNNQDHIGKYDFQSGVTSVSEEGFASFKLKHLGTVLRFQLAVPKDKRYNKFELTTSDNYNLQYSRYLEITDDGASVDDYNPRFTYTTPVPQDPETTYSFDLTLKSEDGSDGFVPDGPVPGHDDLTMLTLYMMVPATTELVGKSLYGIVSVEGSSEKYYASFKGKEFLPGQGVGYGAYTSTAESLNITLSVNKKWQLGNTQTRAGDPGVDDVLLPPDHLVIYLCKDGKYVSTYTTDVNVTSGDNKWQGWNEVGDQWFYKSNLLINYGPKPTNDEGLHAYIVAWRGNTSPISATELQSNTTIESVVADMTYNASDTAMLRNLYTYDYKLDKNDRPILNATLYHTCAKLDVQWNSASALSTSGYVSVNGVPTTNLSLFNPVDCGGSVGRNYSEAITTGNKYNGRAVFYVPQLSSQTYNISVGSSSGDIIFTAPTTNKWTSWFKANIKK